MESCRCLFRKLGILDDEIYGWTETQEFIKVRLIVIAFSAIGLSGNAMSVNGAEVRSRNKTFADWCRGKADLSPETKHTVEVLLKEAETTDCDAGDRNLSWRSILDLSRNEISGIKPLASLTKVIILELDGNPIAPKN